MTLIFPSVVSSFLEDSHGAIFRWSYRGGASPAPYHGGRDTASHIYSRILTSGSAVVEGRAPVHVN